MKNRDIQNWQERNGLILSDEMSFNKWELILRFGFTLEWDGTKWLLRIPRRTTLGEQIADRNTVLQLVSEKYLSGSKFLIGV